ncbi:zinc finger CCHC domain-containing protein 7-like [Uloborus diversus]|uniref:zinc finger CCHC domain-containing protein 7-like n=1 Tax=Uloborus diversus TaxID=327109 RepID=UPI00240A356B|nr:zinc finger CCHC domain-containing protein 7-like [Uloborus diversus]
MFSDLDEYEKTSCTDSDESYSDQINSDVEAELYGLIHHEQNEEFSRTPDMKMLNAENNSNHKEHISTPKHSSFATEDSSFLKLFKSFETTSKSYFSTPQSHLSISTQNSFSERLDDSPAKCSSFNDMNKRKRDLLEADEEKKRKKSVVASKTSNNLTNSKNFVDSSESDDSIIVLEPSKDFTTNLSAHDTVELSSDDSSDSDFFSSRLNSVRSDVNSKRSTFSSSFKNGKTISDPWHVNNEDLFRTGKNSKSLNRYHNKMLQKCTNCNESGHAARSCTVPQQKKEKKRKERKETKRRRKKKHVLVDIMCVLSVRRYVIQAHLFLISYEEENHRTELHQQSFLI